FNYYRRTEQIVKQLLEGEWVRYEEDQKVPSLDLGFISKDVYLYRNRDSLFVNEYLVRTGNAVVDETRDFLRKPTLLKAQSLAKQERRGIWADPAATDPKEVAAKRLAERRKPPAAQPRTVAADPGADQGRLQPEQCPDSPVSPGPALLAPKRSRGSDPLLTGR